MEILVTVCLQRIFGGICYVKVKLNGHGHARIELRVAGRLHVEHWATPIPAPLVRVRDLKVFEGGARLRNKPLR